MKYQCPFSEKNKKNKKNSIYFYTQPHDSGEVLWYHIGCLVCPSICLSVCHTSVGPCFRFQTITWVNVNGFSPNSVCALILWRSGFGLLIGKFHQFLTELSSRNRSIFSIFKMITLVNVIGFSPHLVCAFILWRSTLGLLIGRFRQFLTELSARDTIMAGYYRFTY